MSNKFEPLELGEVVSLTVYDDYDENIQYEEGMFKMPPTFKKSELEESIKNVLIGFDRYYIDTRRKLFDEGLSCEALKFKSQDWQRGKIRVRIEVDFCPDEPESLISECKSEASQSLNNQSLNSSLDDIRSIINEN